MILGGLEFLILGAVVGGLVVSYWKDIVIWVKETYEKLAPYIKLGMQGMVSYIEKMSTNFKNIVNYYSYDEKNCEWTETVMTKTVSEKQIPKEILEKLKSRTKIETTKELKQVLEMKH